eukprot:CAMPEP_0172540508 /NCGR_PEP_ID=MMETSP1067-20121228/11499_1 /TAXON_ID=265564 ORGANISM="Thalassiosira punctigera, Strain Tpunct2005C2" /NCGR_SAMPLE_ID=MMETSP1067 /ASSEMBLY_ACC=CAM_ASM_000444 /LENGTH=121 /DNA_ID=CAMNT_0013326379 /DNA_START=362 /DNA_END=730 /DNA_ORIENTATION=+
MSQVIEIRLRTDDYSHSLLDFLLFDGRRSGEIIHALPAFVAGVVTSAGLAPLDPSLPLHDESLRGALVRLQAALLPEEEESAGPRQGWGGLVSETQGIPQEGAQRRRPLRKRPQRRREGAS